MSKRIAAAAAALLFALGAAAAPGMHFHGKAPHPVAGTDMHYHA